MFLGGLLGFVLCMVLMTLFPSVASAANGIVRRAWAWSWGLVTEEFGGPLTATSEGVVSVAAHKLRLGLVSVEYAAVQNAVTGLRPGERYYVWTIDEHFEGGVRTWRASTDLYALNDEPGAVIAGAITIPLAGGAK